MTRIGPARLCAALALCVLSGVLAGLWLNGWFLARWQDRTAAADMDGDGIEERLLLKRRRLTVERDGAVLWQTRPEWKTESFLWGDIDRDGAPELLVLVWKRGSYGAHRPFWETEEDNSWSQHIFLYHWREGTCQPFWMSSRLRPEVAEWSLNGNGTIRILTKGGEDTCWAWITWGLERIDR